MANDLLIIFIIIAGITIAIILSKQILIWKNAMLQQNERWYKDAKRLKLLQNKIKSVKLCMMAHPDNIQGSEFEDRISDLEEIENVLSKKLKN